MLPCAILSIFSSFLTFCYCLTRLKDREIICKIWETRKIFLILYSALCDNNYISHILIISLLSSLLSSLTHPWTESWTLKRRITKNWTSQEWKERRWNEEHSSYPLKDYVLVKYKKRASLSLSHQKCKLHPLFLVSQMSSEWDFVLPYSSKDMQLFLFSVFTVIVTVALCFLYLLFATFSTPIHRKWKKEDNRPADKWVIISYNRWLEEGSNLPHFT